MLSSTLLQMLVATPANGFNVPPGKNVGTRFLVPQKRSQSSEKT